jgi:hypothetical protein
MRRAWAAAAIAAAVLWGARADAQTLIDRVVVRVNNDIITLSDVSQARLLRLAPPEATSDSGIVEALINRRLILAEIVKFPASEPTTAELAARRQEWQATLGPQADVGELLRRAGMSDALLDGWLRDDVRIQSYLDRRFLATTIPRRDALLKYYEDHPTEFVRDGARLSFEEAQPDIRTKVAAQTRAANIAKWLDGLRARADIVYIR